MTTKNPLNCVGVFLACLTFFDVTAKAQTVSFSNGGYETFSAETTDLGESATLTLTSGSALYGSSIDNLNDGTVYGDPATVTSDTGSSFTPTNDSVVTFALSGSPTGYDLSNIIVLTGDGGGQYRSEQVYDVSYSTVAAPTTFLNLATVDGSDPNDIEATSTEVQSIISGLTATDVADVQFTFFNGSSSDESIYREIDINGIVSVPEPNAATLLFGALAFMGLLTWGRWRWAQL